MMSEIDSRAIVSTNASIGKNVEINPYAIIEDDVVIGDNTIIGSHSIIKKYTTLGKNNVVHSHVVLGDTPQDLAFDKTSKSYLTIGDNNIFREFSNIHRASKENSHTKIGNNCYFMASSHAGHDCEILDNVIICNGSLLAGHCKVDNNVFISGNCVVHQFLHIGAYVMVSGMAAILRDVLPYTLTTMAGKALSLKINIVGLRRAGFTSEDIKEVELSHAMWYDWNSTKVAFLERYLNDDSLSKITREVVLFVSKSTRGIINKAR